MWLLSSPLDDALIGTANIGALTGNNCHWIWLGNCCLCWIEAKKMGVFVKRAPKLEKVKLFDQHFER